jgi:hypothetical protein
MSTWGTKNIVPPKSTGLIRGTTVGFLCALLGSNRAGVRLRIKQFGSLDYSRLETMFLKDGQMLKAAKFRRRPFEGTE